MLNNIGNFYLKKRVRLAIKIMSIKYFLLGRSMIPLSSNEAYFQ